MRLYLQETDLGWFLMAHHDDGHYEVISRLNLKEWVIS